MHSVVVALEKALGFLIRCGLVILLYWLAKVLISIRIKDNSKAYTKKGKVITVVFCLIGSGLAPAFLYGKGLSLGTVLPYFIIIFSTSLVAMITCYKKGPVDTISHDESPRSIDEIFPPK